MADDPSTAVWTTIITAAATIAAVFFGARYTAKVTVQENRRQHEEGRSATRRTDAVEVSARIDSIRSLLISALREAENLSRDPNNKGAVIISTNVLHSTLRDKASGMSDRAARATDLYQRYLACGTRFENTHFNGNWNETRQAQRSWIAILWLQASEVAEAVADAAGLSRPVIPFSQRVKMRILRWQLPRKWKREVGL